MFSPDELLAQAKRRYLDFLRSIVEGAPFFPLELRIGKTRRAESYAERLRELATFRDAARELGIAVEWRTVNDPRFGSHERPERAFFADESTYLGALGLVNEVRAFREDLATIHGHLPSKWILENIRSILDYHGAWPQLLRVIVWFRANPCSGLYLRQIPVQGVDTKFFERHLRILDSILEAESSAAITAPFEDRHGLRREEPLIRFRFLDRVLQSRHLFPVDDLAIPVSSFRTLPLPRVNVVVTENLRNFLALPDLPETVGIFGGGNALSLLSGAEWLKESNIHYWGDIDAQGFDILSRLREAYPQTRSLMMDTATLDAAGDLVGVGIPSFSSPSCLTSEEQALFGTVRTGNLRLEQERLPFDYVVSCLRSAIREIQTK